MYFQSLWHYLYPARTNLLINQSVYLYFNLKSALLSIAKQQCSNCLCHMIAILLVVYNFAINIIFLPGYGILHLIYENTISASKQTYNTLLFQWGKFATGSFDQRTTIFLYYESLWSCQSAWNMGFLTVSCTSADCIASIMKIMNNFALFKPTIKVFGL